MLAALDEATGDPAHPPVGVVVFAAANPHLTSGGIDQARESVWAISTVIRAIIGGWHGQAPRLWLVTRGGLALDNEAGQPGIGALKGLVRVLAYEHPELQTTLLDLDVTSEPLTALKAELDCGGFRHDRRRGRLARRASDTSSGCPAPPSTSPPAKRSRSGASYIITGGLGGLGLVVARWLVDSGAGRIVLNGRSEPSDEQRKVLAELERQTEIAVVCGDVASAGVADTLSRRPRSKSPICAASCTRAAVIDDSLVFSMTKDSVERVWAPKAIGALRMHQASLGSRTGLVARILLHRFAAGPVRAGRLRVRERVARCAGRRGAARRACRRR